MSEAIGGTKAMGHRRTVLPALILTVLTVAALVVASAFSTPAQAQKRLALVIGNDRYANLPADKQLLKAAKDAEAVGDALATLGFTVIRGQNLGRQGMIDKLSAFTAQLQPGDTAAFFYAGHGVAIGGVNYLVPSDVPAVTPDAEARVRGNSIAEGDIVGEIQAKGARVALLVIDACRDNPFPRSGTRSIGNTRGLADAKPARGVFTIYSAGIGQTALDRLEKNDPNPNSVFTRVFVQQLARADRHLVDMVVEVREQVAALALKATDDAGRPVPHEQTPAYYDQTIGGHIYLAGRTPPPKAGREPDDKEPAQREPAGQQVVIATPFSATEALAKGAAENRAGNYAEAMRWFRTAADQGSASAQNNIGILYNNGQGVKQDYAEAMRWYQKAAEQGNVGAQVGIGILYDNGRGVKQDYAAAMRWYQKAAVQENAKAQILIGILYANGQGVKKDYAEAMRWYQKAAVQEDAFAQVMIGILYANGKGVRKDSAEAIRWYQKAAEQGNVDARSLIDQLEKQRAQKKGSRHHGIRQSE